MAYPSWVPPQPLDTFGGFQGGFNVGSVMGGQAADRRAFDQWQAESNVPYGQTPQTANPSTGYLAGPGQQPQPGSLASLSVNSYGQPQAPQQPQNVVAGSHGAVHGATVPGLQGGLESYISTSDKRGTFLSGWLESVALKLQRKSTQQQNRSSAIKFPLNSGVDQFESVPIFVGFALNYLASRNGSHGRTRMVTDSPASFHELRWQIPHSGYSFHLPHTRNLSDPDMNLPATRSGDR